MNGVVTLLDIVKQQAANTALPEIVEVMEKSNPILEMLPFEECNNGMVNKTPVRTGLPTGTWRRLYGGVPAEKSSVTTVTDDCGMLESFIKIDCDVADKAPNKAKYLLNEEKAFIEGLSQTMAHTFFYGDSKKDKEQFTGLSARYDKHSGTDEDISSYNVITGGSTTANVNTSIWVVSNDAQRVCGLYPQHSVAGLQNEDLGKKLVPDTNGNDYLAYVKHFKWDCGFTVKDWRYVSRVCNIDSTALVNAGTSGYSGAELINLLIKATDRLPDNATNVCIYANRDVITALDLLALNRDNVLIGMQDWAGRKITTFRGIPVKRCAAIKSTEKLVSAA